MRYMILFHDDHAKWGALSQAEMDAVMAQHDQVARALKTAGKYVCCASLEPPDKASTIRFRNGKRTVVDGPFAETKELVGGFYIIEADDKADAVDWAMKLPQHPFCVTEIRPVHEML